MKKQEITLQGDQTCYISTTDGLVEITRKKGDRKTLIIHLPDRLDATKHQERAQPKSKPAKLKVVG